MKKISIAELQSAVERAGLPAETFARIEGALAAEPETAPAFEAAHVSYYLGALLIIGAMGWFITSGWDRLSGWTIAGIAAAYAVVFGGVGLRLFRRTPTRIPGGLLVAVAVCMTPLAVYGLERAAGWWPSRDPGSYTRFHPWIDASWVVMEIATVLVAALALWRVRFPFITAPAAYALWFLSMDGTAWLCGAHWTWQQECHISTIFGLAMLVVAWLLDGVPEMDFAFWFYLFGLLTFTGGLTLLDRHNEWGKAAYCLIHLAMLVVAVAIRRRAFLVFGGLGVFCYLAGEAQAHFRNSVGFTFALTAIGAAFIVAGVAWKKNETRLEAKLAPWTPARIRYRHAQGIGEERTY
ncbi:MAG TPA: hypothetical protein VIY53_05075 [Acidobacteriaceae bacterium]